MPPQETEKDLEVQHTMEHQVYAPMEVGEGSNFNAEILTENSFQRLIGREAGRKELCLCILKCVETDSHQIVKEQFQKLKFSIMALMGYEVRRAKLHDDVNLTKDLKKSILVLGALLPAAKLKIGAGKIEVCNTEIDKEAIHVATRLCYHIYIIWNLLVITICRGDDLKDQQQKLIFHEILLLHNEHNMLTSEAETTAVGFDNPDVKELMKSRSRIDNKFLKLVMNELAKRRQDKMLYDLWQMMEVTVNNSIQVKDKVVDNPNESTMWPCSAKSHFDIWLIEMAMAVLHMNIEKSYQHTNEKSIQNLERLDYIRDFLPEVVRLKAQFKVEVDIKPNVIVLIVRFRQVSAYVKKEKQTGHFPSGVYLSVVPVDAGLTGVHMTGPSPNSSVKVAVTEKVGGDAKANLKVQGPSVGFGVGAGKEVTSEVERKFWTMQHNLEDDGKGSSFTFDYLWKPDDNKSDALNPVNRKPKSSPGKFGSRIPINPLLELPFARDGSVNFTADDYKNAMEWRYPKNLENTTLVFKIVGYVHTTCTQPPFWETRTMPFECQLEQKLEASR